MFTLEALVIVAFATLTVVCCIVLVFHRQYHDGLIGRFALSLIGVAAVARVLQICQALMVGVEPQIGKPNCVLWVGVGIFLARHAFNFYRRLHKQNGTWYKERGSK